MHIKESVLYEVTVFCRRNISVKLGVVGVECMQPSRHRQLRPADLLWTKWTTGGLKCSPAERQRLQETNEKPHSQEPPFVYAQLGSPWTSRTVDLLLWMSQPEPWKYYPSCQISLPKQEPITWPKIKVWDRYYTERFATTIFRATQCYLFISLTILFQFVLTFFQHCFS